MDDNCIHAVHRIGRFEIISCGECGDVNWFEEGRPIEAEAGMAGVFGNYDLVGSVRGVRAPADHILVYRPPSMRHRRALDAFHPHVWFQAGPRIWLCHDTEHLMLAPTDPLLAANLARQA